MKNIYLLFCIPLLWIQTAFAEEPIKLKVHGYEVPPSAMEVTVGPGIEEVRGLFQTPEPADQFTVTVTRPPSLFVQNNTLMGQLYAEENAKILENMTNCGEYKGDHNPFRIFNVFGEHIEQLENCLSLSMDRSIGRICADEKTLDTLEKTYRNDAAVMAQIEEYRETLDPLKEDAVDQIYIIADIFNELDATMEDKIAEAYNSDSLEDIFLQGLTDILVTDTKEGFARFFESKMQTLCGYNVFTDRDGDGRQIMQPRLFNGIDTTTLKPEEIEELKDRIAERFDSDSMNDVLIRSLANVLISSERDAANERQIMQPR